MNKNYKSPARFEKAWNDLDIQMRGNWQNVIKKEFGNKEKNDVWNICNINEKP